MYSIPNEFLFAQNTIVIKRTIPFRKSLLHMDAVIYAYTGITTFFFLLQLHHIKQGDTRLDRLFK